MKKIALVVLVIGCSSSTAPGTGKLTVTVAGLDSVSASVTVTGPSGYKKTVATTTTLTGLAPGSYAITAATVTSPDAIVGSVYLPTITGSPAAVTAGGDAAASATYAMRPGTGTLWVVGALGSTPNTANGAIGFNVAQLRTSSSGTPAVHLTFPVTPGGNVDANDVAIDAQGNFWVANENSNTAVEYAPSSLNASGTPTPVVTLQQPVGSYTTSLAFDANGDLWVANGLANTVVEFTANQLTSSGSPTPAVTITTVLPEAIRFDSHGTLWVLNTTSDILYGYSPSQLTASGQPLPSVTVNLSAPAPYGMAFDASGNLWIAALGSLIEMSSSSLAASGTPTPAVTLTLPDPNDSPITAIAFDNSGELWYADFDHGIISELLPSQLSTTASVTPTVSLVYGPTPLFYGTALAFNPHTAGLPLH